MRYTDRSYDVMDRAEEERKPIPPATLEVKCDTEGCTWQMRPTFLDAEQDVKPCNCPQCKSPLEIKIAEL